MKVLIVEDETAAYENLMDILTEITPDIRIMANTESVTQTVGWLQSNPAPEDVYKRQDEDTGSGGVNSLPKLELSYSACVCFFLLKQAKRTIINLKIKK